MMRMTWGEFVEWMKAQGVLDSDEISFIDFSGVPHLFEAFTVKEENTRYVMVS